jgi:hypothetical protein
VRCLVASEAYDSAWIVTINGQVVDHSIGIASDDGQFLLIPLGEGEQAITLRSGASGVGSGLWLFIAGAILALLFLWIDSGYLTKRQENQEANRQ